MKSEDSNLEDYGWVRWTGGAVLSQCWPGSCGAWPIPGEWIVAIRNRAYGILIASFPLKPL